ncbi:MAG: HhH-GPD-type base excision DNA repair protein [Intrasporangium sp.]|uniref:HhH-GPD-type base excision DNA repair protein n=1 Tax=Intrasporangium sp. TaxID=1925024 RepID=UPI003F818376
MTLHLATTDDGNALLERDPLALMLGMLLDQQIPMEKAFTSPSVLAERLGVDRLDAAAIAAMPPEELLELFRTPPALHRFPGSMAERTQQLCQALVEHWDADAAAVWRDVDSGAELVRRVGTLPGFGAQKARIFVALLAKQFGVQPAGWQEATGDYGQDGFRSIADVVDDASKVKVREFKKEMKARARAGAARADA